MSYELAQFLTMVITVLAYYWGILIGDLGKSPKVQKFHGSEELYKVFKRSFKTVQVKRIATNLSVIARGPAYTAEQLEQAIEFEFNLPYPDGSRMDMVEQAKSAFRERGCMP